MTPTSLTNHEPNMGDEGGICPMCETRGCIFRKNIKDIGIFISQINEINKSLLPEHETQKWAKRFIMNDVLNDDERARFDVLPTCAERGVRFLVRSHGQWWREHRAEAVSRRETE